MTLSDLYQTLQAHFGSQANPGTWWPIYHGKSDPPEFERVITNILVQHSNWRAVHRAVNALNEEDLLTAAALARAQVTALAACVKPTGLQGQKASRLKALGQWVLRNHGTEAAFCADVTRDELLRIGGIGDETADRTLLYACARLAWPVDTYCLRVLAHHGIIAEVPASPAARRRVAAEIKQMVEDQIPRELDDWQRLHALMQLAGEDLRRE